MLRSCDVGWAQQPLVHVALGLFGQVLHLDNQEALGQQAAHEEDPRDMLKARMASGLRMATRMIQQGEYAAAQKVLEKCYRIDKDSQEVRSTSTTKTKTKTRQRHDTAAPLQCPPHPPPAVLCVARPERRAVATVHR